LQLHLRLLLYPSAKRGDVGSFVSSLRALQVAAHYLFGWQVWQLRGEEGQRTMRGGGTAVAYPELHVRLWSNPSLPSNMQLVAAQRALLQRLPTIVAQAFGQRDVADIIRAAVQSAYIRHGVHAHHEPQAQQQQQQPQPPPQAASAEQHDGAGSGACEEQRFAASFGAQFPETFAQLLSVLQSFLAKRSADDEESDDAFLRKQERALPRSGDGGGGTGAAAAPPSLATSTLVNTIAALAPASAYGRTSSSTGSSAAASSSSATGASSDVVPLRFALRHPLLPQFARPLQSSLSLLKKSVAWVGGVEMQMRSQGTGSNGSNQRNVRLQLRGAEFAAIYAFLQHALPMDASSNEEDASAAAAASAHRRLAGLSLFTEWLGLLRAAVVPSRRAAAAAAAATDPGQVHAQQLVRRVVLANLHAHEQSGTSKSKPPA
jgi:hypothetical protein